MVNAPLWTIKILLVRLQIDCILVAFMLHFMLHFGRGYQVSPESEPRALPRSLPSVFGDPSAEHHHHHHDLDILGERTGSSWSSSLGVKAAVISPSHSRS